MLAHPQRLLRRNAAGGTLLRCSARIHSDEVLENRVALYPLPTQPLRLFVEEGALAPQFR